MSERVYEFHARLVICRCGSLTLAVSEVGVEIARAYLLAGYPPEAVVVAVPEELGPDFQPSARDQR